MKKKMRMCCFIIVCVGVGIFLYSRMHEEYPMETDGDMPETETEIENVVFPQSYQKTVSDLLRFDVEVNAQADTQEFYSATATRTVIDVEGAYNLFLGEEGAVEHTEYTTMDMEGDRVEGDGYKADGKSLSVEKQSFSYFEKQYTHVQNSFFESASAKEYNAYLYSTESDLDFMGREAAWENLKKDLESLGLDMSTAVSTVTYSLDAETMEKEENYTDVNGNEVPEEKKQDWTKEDDGYLYYITQDNQGTPVYLYDELQQDEEHETPLRVFQSDEGIIFAYLNRWFDIEIGEERLSLKPFESIMAVVEEKYSGTITTNPLTVKKATLYTFPIKTEDGIYLLTPVWVCTLEEKHMEEPENIYTSNIYMGINAVTGEEI